MPLNRDDIISEVAVSGSSGISCNRAEIVIDPVKRTLRVNFNLVKITDDQVCVDRLSFNEDKRAFETTEARTFNRASDHQISNEV